MDLSYLSRYNERAVENREAYNVEALQFLDDHFKKGLTALVEACLEERPEKPIVFIADRLREAASTSVDECVRNKMSPDTPPPKTFEKGKKSRSNNFLLRFPGGLHAELKGVSHLSKPPENVATGVPVVKLLTPTTYDIIQTMRHMEVDAITTHERAHCATPVDESSTPEMKDLTSTHITTNKAPMTMLLIVESPAPPEELVFIKGIPYLHDLTDTLQYKFRCQSADVPLPYPNQTFPERALQLLKVALGANHVQSLDEVLASLSSTKNPAMQPASSAVNASPSPLSLAFEWVTVHLPWVRCNYLATFDAIDRGFRAVSALCPKAPFSVLFVSYREAHSASLTFARVLSAFFPFWERIQLEEMQRIRQQSLLRIRHYDMGFCLRYWAEVHRRREERDARRGIRLGALRKRLGASSTLSPGATFLNTTLRGKSFDRNLQKNSPPTPRCGENDAAFSATTFPKHSFSATPEETKLETDNSAEWVSEPRGVIQVPLGGVHASLNKPFKMTSLMGTTAVIEKQRPLKKQLERDLRRQQEDSDFLSIVRTHQSAAATRLQALFRGHRARCHFPPPAVQDALRPSRQMAGYFGSLTLFPPTLPPLLRLCANRLRDMHGELFGNYVTSPPPQPRQALIYTPKRRQVFSSGAALLPCGQMGCGSKGDQKEREEDTESEVEEWEAETVLVPTQRQTCVAPHFNPLERLLEYYHLAGCNILHDAVQLMVQCTGMTVLQNRAYDQIKSVSLDLMHVAHSELFHRGKLAPGENTVFSYYMRTNHTDVLAWFACPHLVSLSTRAATTVPPAGHCAGPVCRLKVSTSPLLHQSVLATAEVMRHERVLVRAAYSEHGDGSDSDLGERGDDGTPREVPAAGCECWRRLTEKVYWLPPAVAAPDVEQLLRHIGSVFSPLSHNHIKHGHSCEGVALGDAQATEAEKPSPQQSLLWCNMCTYPMCYVGSDPFVLMPRQSQQRVEGSAAYDDYVMHHDARRCGVPKEENAAHGKRPHELGVFHFSSPVPRNPTKRFLVSSAMVSVVEELSECFQSQLLAEDEQLKCRILQGVTEKNLIFTHYVPAADTTPALQEGSWVGPCASVMPCSPSHDMGQKTISHPQLLSSLKDVKHAPALVRKSFTLQFPSAAVQSPLEALRSRDTSPHAWELFSSSSAHTPCPSLDSENQAKVNEVPQVSYFKPPVRTAQEVLSDVAAKVLGDGPLSICYLRPWMPPLATGGAWLKRLEGFLDIVLARLKGKDKIMVLCADAGDHQTVYIASTLLLSLAMGDSMTQRLGVSDGVCCLLKDTNGEHDLQFAAPLHFLNDFVALLRSHFPRTGTLVEECISRVDRILHMLHTMQGSGAFSLDSIAEMVRAAEHEPDRASCKKAILSIVQNTEHFCWLLILNIFFSLPFTREALDPYSTSTLGSFAYFAQANIALVHWIESIDPWLCDPERSPDATHLRYSNGLRRWDKDDYVCFGVIS